MRLHPSLRIAWLNDSLPELSRVRAMRRHFDLVMLTAVWMHLDPKQRARAMPHVAALVRPGGVMILSLRHGPVPQGRRMFDVSATETERLAAADGLVLILRYDFLDGALRRPGISWSRLAFRKPCTG